jgi:dGTPase
LAAPLKRSSNLFDVLNAPRAAVTRPTHRCYTALMLAPYAVRVDDSRGRRYPEPPHSYRNPFQRDRDRVIHARAFRRLENKTQVFTRRYSDHFRTRLTHTMEVAQISRTIAAALNLNVDLVEALALVHDIGHPPFGHAGERVLDELMRQRGQCFDHNLQALRTVEDLELRYAKFRGLNLTFEVREGIIKHSHDYSPAEHPELAEYLLDLRPPLEAQLIDLTDEIAYSTADLDDGFEARLLRLPQIRQRVRVFERYYVEAEAKYPDAPEKLKFNEALKRVLNRFVTDLIESTARRVQEAGVTSLEELRRFPNRLAGFSSEVEEERREAKSFLYEALYNCKRLEPEKRKAEKVVTEVFQHLLTHPEALPHGFQERTQTEKLERVVCDYIAGMTDHYAEDLRKKLLTAKKAEA